FYIGALGSRGNTAKRRERLAMFDLTPAEIERLHGPIGLDIGAKTPAEIAVSIVAEIVAGKNGIVLMQKKEGSSVPAARAAGGEPGARFNRRGGRARCWSSRRHPRSPATTGTAGSSRPPARRASPA